MKRAGWAVTLFAAALLLLPSSASAHAGAAPLAFWGEFSLAISRCQRRIGHAASLCPLRAIRARTECRLRDLHGDPCPPTQANDEVQSARALARATVRARCSAQQVQILRYIDVNETLTDVISICREMDNRVMAWNFAPVNANPAAVAADPQAIACVQAASQGTTQVLQVALDSHRRALDRIATRGRVSLNLTRKRQLIDHSRARIARAIAAAAAATERQCPAEIFASLYHRSAAEHFARMGLEAECFGGAVYVQDEAVCPDELGGPPVPSPFGL